MWPAIYLLIKRLWEPFPVNSVISIMNLLFPLIKGRLTITYFQSLRLWGILSVFALPSLLSAENNTANAEHEQEHGRLGNTLLVANEFFNSTLPGTLGRYNLALDFQPKIGDLLRREYIRFPLTLRYGFADDWEALAGFTPVTPNPFKSGDGQKWSFGEYRLGLRHNVRPILPIWEQMTIGLDFRSPLGRPPVQLIDGYAHIRPFLTVARPILQVDNTLLFLNLSYDYSIDAPFRNSTPPPPIVRRHEFDITPGIIYKPTELGYFAEYTLRFIEEPNDHRRAHIYTVGFIWDPPRSRTRLLRLPGNWQFELGYRLTDEQQRSIGHSIQFRARWRGDLREILQWGNRLRGNGD